MVQQPTNRESEVTAHELIKMPTMAEADAITREIEMKLPPQAMVDASQSLIPVLRTGRSLHWRAAVAVGEVGTRASRLFDRAAP